jgi:hypothetical protein
MTDSLAQPIRSDSTSAHESDAPHDEHHVHVYPTSGIAEGNARLPLWFVAVIGSLLLFFVGYIVVQWNAQPSSAHAK